MDTNALLSDIFGSGGGIWFMMGAALVFFMQCGFAGLTRAKSAGNIIMKNMIDFCIGTIMFMLIGYSLLVGQDAGANFIGAPSTLFAMSADQLPNFFFNLMFCATAATIVSGAMAERTRFAAYCVYSGAISLVVYPIEAGWVWGGGWLADLGFVDFAGSVVIHMVGGISALIGAMFLGQRHPRSLAYPRRSRRVHPLVRLVRIQRRGRFQRFRARSDPHQHHARSRSRYRRLHVLHLGAQQEARRVHVP